jgi:hypothetical protein
MKTKACTKCKVEKQRSDFTKDKNRNDGLASSCKNCNNKIKLDTINYLDEIEKFNSQMEELENKISDKRKEFISWCQKNKNEIKKRLPKIGNVYQVVDIENSSCYGYDSRYHDEDEVFYFKVLDTSFKPSEDLKYRGGLTLKVKGELLDCNYRKVGKLYHIHDEIKISHLIEIEKKTEPKVIADKFTQVYVMIDKNTGYYKIGRSLNPFKREKTLQSEKPTIELLHTHNAKTIDERNLHSMFKDKRIRGEWFDLSGSDVQAINAYFNNKDTKELDSEQDWQSVEDCVEKW